PLGHYMVMGTTNSVLIDDGRAAASMEGGPGMGPGSGGGRLGFGWPAQPGVPGRGPAGPAAGGEFGAAPGGAAPGAAAAGGPEGAAPSKGPINTSRFAFVVQVVEGQSYPADEKEKAASKK